LFCNMNSKNTAHHNFIKWFENIQETDVSLVGGKGFNLGLLFKAGFRVPNGFCITTSAYKTIICNSKTFETTEIPHDIAEEILLAYDKLGSGRIAVRSSATMEDSQYASFAGQQDTFLNIHGEQELLEATRKCWRSLSSDRSIAYRQQIGMDDRNISMAVIIQKMVDSDLSGIMFSVSPFKEGQLMIEASWGLGESVVSGKVTPDSFTVDRNTLQIIDCKVSQKKVMLTKKGELDVPLEKQDISSLNDNQVKQLAELGLEIENFYSGPQDIEWALLDGEFYILQSRPITVKSYQQSTDWNLEQLRQQEISRLMEIADNSGTVWGKFNLSETLPEPLPMTWSVIAKFMSGKGGFGLAYRELGFMPGRELDETGTVDLICGRTYTNLSKDARLYFGEFPFEHSFKKLKENPMNVSYSQPTVNIRRSTVKFWLKFPYYIYKMLKADQMMKRIRKNYDTKLRTEIIKEYQDYIREQRKIQLSELSDSNIISKINEWIDKTLRDFAKDSLKASILAGMSYSNLKLVLEKCFGEDSQTMLEDLIVGLNDSLPLDMNQKLWEIAHDKSAIEQFIDEYGHRAVGEFELAQPRWREDSDYIGSMVDTFREQMEIDPKKQFLSQKKRREKAEEKLNELLANGQAKAYKRTILRETEYAQRYLPYRELNKFYLMMGYELIRMALLELDHRHFGSQGDIFYLELDELTQMANSMSKSESASIYNSILERRQRREALLSLELPDIIFSDSLNDIGNTEPAKAAREYDGIPVSSGVAEGEAKIFIDPDSHSGNLGVGYILVCVSTDPGWAPLFPNARGLVMEHGGVLSHGAIIAREYGIPAVANVVGATKAIRNGQQIIVDGDKGKVFGHGLKSGQQNT